MRRDSIFYKIFQQSPTLLFDLLRNSPANSNAYRFDSVAVKEPKFEIDGVFIPPQTDGTGVIYFCEVQFQKDERLYERLFGESFLYFYRNRDRYSDWQAVVIYPNRSLEQSNFHPIIEMVTTILVYKFEQLSRAEVESMLAQRLQDTRVYKEIKAEGELEMAVSIVLRQLTRRLGVELDSQLRSQISSLPLPVLERLGEDLLDFTSMADLQSWLAAQ